MRRETNLKGIICTILTRPYRMDVFLFSGRCILGIPHSPCKLGILHRRRQLLLPTLHMEEIVNFLVDKEKGEKNHLKSSARSFSSLLQVLPVSHQSLSLSFLFDSTFLIWFPLPGFLVLAFAVHVPSFPFSNHLFIVIFASLL